MLKFNCEVHYSSHSAIYIKFNQSSISLYVCGVYVCVRQCDFIINERMVCLPAFHFVYPIFRQILL